MENKRICENIWSAEKIPELDDDDDFLEIDPIRIQVREFLIEWQESAFQSLMKYLRK